ncbi:MAG TPA: heme-binding protein, partial [Paenalcaligenes hominis]|nr:heme-binding protein [Paenalcaligenes hominis]
MDQAPVQSITLAISKAYTAARLGIATTAFHAQLQQERLQTQDYMDAQLTAVPGGTPLYGSDHRLIGAIGVSGRHTQNDQTLADAVATYFQSI